MHYPLLWKFRVLRGIKGNGRAENRKLFDAWGKAEGGTAKNNPLNTTEPWHGATDYNSAGVKNYATGKDGIDATVTTLLNGFYPGIVGDLRSPIPRTAVEIVLRNPKEFNTWGTGATNILRVLESGQV